MRGLWLENERVRFREDVPDPQPPSGEALVRVRLAGVCNTDLEMVNGYYPFTGVPGHEFVGEVESAPEAPEWAGRRVAGEINAACGACARLRRRTPLALRAAHRPGPDRPERDVRREAHAPAREPARRARRRSGRGGRLHGAAGRRPAHRGTGAALAQRPRGRDRRRQARTPGGARVGVRCGLAGGGDPKRARASRFGSAGHPVRARRGAAGRIGGCDDRVLRSPGRPRHRPAAGAPRRDDRPRRAPTADGPSSTSSGWSWTRSRSSARAAGRSPPRSTGWREERFRLRTWSRRPSISPRAWTRWRAPRVRARSRCCCGPEARQPLRRSRRAISLSLGSPCRRSMAGS